MTQYLMVGLAASSLMFGCVSKHRFAAEYEAPLSGVRASVRSAVIVKNPDTLEGNRAYAVIEINPIRQRTGMPVQVHAGFEEENANAGWFVVDNIKTAWSWSDPGPLIRLLVSRGYSDLNDGEMKRLNHALFNSLSSPKGFVLEGQGREIRVVKAIIEHHANIDTRKPGNEWVAAQPAAEPDASRR